jgi:hypothetical protein
MFERRGIRCTEVRHSRVSRSPMFPSSPLQFERGHLLNVLGSDLVDRVGEKEAVGISDQKTMISPSYAGMFAGILTQCQPSGGRRWHISR